MGILRLQMPDNAIFSRHTQMERPGKKLLPEIHGKRRMQIQPVMVPAKNPPVRRAKPDDARFIFIGVNDFADRAAGFKIFHLAVLDRTEAGGFRADPQIRPAVFKQKNDAVARQAGRVVDVEAREGVAVEADKAVERAEPEVAVARLRERDDGTLRQAVGGAPHIHDERRVRRHALSQNQCGGEADDTKMDSPFQSLRGEYAFASGGKRFFKNRLRVAWDGLGFRCP